MAAQKKSRDNKIMIKSSLLTGLFFIMLAGGLAGAQSPCPAGVASNKLICVIPQTFGVNGLAVSDTGLDTVQGTFGSSFPITSLNSVESAVGRQSALTPIASPSSGMSFSWDATAKVFVASTESFGPILGERAGTIAKGKIFLGFDYQSLNFSGLDGLNLKNLPVALPQGNAPDPVDSTITCAVNPANVHQSNFGDCGFIRDALVTQNRLDLRVRQFTTFITYGLTNRLDVSLVLPIEDIRVAFTSNATISHNASDSQFSHAFAPSASCHAPCLNTTFFNSGIASGISDLSLRVKAAAWKGEKAGLALGADIRLPTGDSLNLLGTGTVGIKPFVVWSYRSRVSPHGFVGFEMNGSSVTGGDLTSGTKASLPGQVSYAAGADVFVNRRLTVAADLVGQEVFQAQRTVKTTFVELGQCQDSQANPCDSSVPVLPPKQDPSVTQVVGTYNITNLSLGLKTNPFSTFLLTGNVLIKVNDGGLRARAVPLVGFSYTF